MAALDDVLGIQEAPTGVSGREPAFQIPKETQKNRDVAALNALKMDLAHESDPVNRASIQREINNLQKLIDSGKSYEGLPQGQKVSPVKTQSISALDDVLGISEEPQELGPSINVEVSGGVKTEQPQAPQQVAQATQPTTAEKLVGLGELGLTAASGLVAPIVGGAAGIAQNVLGGTLGTQEGLKKAEETAGQVSEALTYEPRTEAGKAVTGRTMGALQQAFEASKLPPVMPEALPMASAQKPILEKAPVAKPLAVTERIEPTMQKPKITYAELQQQLKEKKAANEPQASLKGVGAARVTTEQERISRAKELPIPIELSKDQATRNPADVRFARETAKDPVLGQALQEKYASDNAKIQNNLDHLVEQTGAEFSGLPEPELAKKLVDTIEPYRKQRRQEVTDAYQLADQAGETNQLVSYKPLVDYIENQTKGRPTKKAQNPILGIVEEELKANDPTGAGKINLKAMDDIYKTIVNETDPTQRGSLYHSGKLRKAFDEATKGAGGDLYRKARKLNAEYMTEFEDTPVIKNLTAIKKGTTQRTVAIENLIDKSILKGTADDVRRLFTTLEKTPEGQTIANELRGYVAQHIKNEATKGVQLDINGLPYVSTKNLDTVIKGLDKSGKLEYLFGKKNAEYYRTLNDATKDIQTVPQGTTNPSGTAAQLASLLAETGAQFALSGVPVPVIGGLKHGYGYLKTKQQLNKIKDFVNYSKEK